MGGCHIKGSPTSSPRTLASTAPEPALVNMQSLPCCMIFALQVGRVLMITRASLKPKNPRFNSTNHEFEIYLERNSQVTACDDDADTAAIPHMMFNVSTALCCRLCYPL